MADSIQSSENRAENQVSEAIPERRMTAMLLKIESLYIGYRADFIDRFRPT